MASSQVKVFSFGRWVDFGAPRQYHAALDLAAELLKVGVLVSITR